MVLRDIITPNKAQCDVSSRKHQHKHIKGLWENNLYIKSCYTPLHNFFKHKVSGQASLNLRKGQHTSEKHHSGGECAELESVQIRPRCLALASRPAWNGMQPGLAKHTRTPKADMRKPNSVWLKLQPIKTIISCRTGRAHCSPFLADSIFRRQTSNKRNNPWPRDTLLKSASAFEYPLCFPSDVYLVWDLFFLHKPGLSSNASRLGLEIKWLVKLKPAFQRKMSLNVSFVPSLFCNHWHLPAGD